MILEAFKKLEDFIVPLKLKTVVFFPSNKPINITERFSVEYKTYFPKEVY